MESAAQVFISLGGPRGAPRTAQQPPEEVLKNVKWKTSEERCKAITDPGRWGGLYTDTFNQRGFYILEGPWACSIHTHTQTRLYYDDTHECPLHGCKLTQESLPPICLHSPTYCLFPLEQHEGHQFCIKDNIAEWRKSKERLFWRRQLDLL